ncbi:MFS sugar transporter [Ascosphaera apis ARSEF 7405]|uniref:MFS sugar transporter n=1 Tax=Ascosphaera apis ARSEF 7405 TaxID=392613 RepID=A0A162HZK6_9EURO|nr:MFS sugar transporter [Ascosphaera apis ARSEF 7405]
MQSQDRQISRVIASGAATLNDESGPSKGSDEFAITLHDLECDDNKSESDNQQDIDKTKNFRGTAEDINGSKFQFQNERRQASFNEANIDLLTAAERARRKLNAKLHNPLEGLSHAALIRRGSHYARFYQIGDEDDIRAFELGAILAQAPEKFEEVEGLREEEKAVLRREFANRWSQPVLMYVLIVFCSMCAAVQGMDETVVNGAQILYKPQLGIGRETQRDAWLTGLVNSAPYLCCAVAGSWLTVPFNHWFGRRGTILLTCCFSAIACLWQGFVNTWWHMFIARFFLGFGIGPKSATVPMYVAEMTPPAIRGALVMQWQVWTAFGIMLGYAADLMFFSVPDPPHITGLSWRLMLASAMVPALFCCIFAFLCPESPRWYLSKGHHYQAYKTLCKLRHDKIQAARDLFYMYTLLEAETKMKLGQPKIVELFTVPRNRRALVASEIVMFMQQFCGVNVIPYYSSEIFLRAKFSEIASLAASFGFGVINWLFAIPAIYTIDTFGRRKLLLFSLPLMSLFLFFAGFSFWIPTDTDAHHSAHIGCIALGVYLYGVVYSPGAGPVPFTYSAEAYPLYVRAYGMSLATATTWFFNFVLAITWPSMVTAFTEQGAFSFYASWNVVGFFLVLMFVPETKGKTLEELDEVFSMSTTMRVKFASANIKYFVQRHILRRHVSKPKLSNIEKRPCAYDRTPSVERASVH